MLSFLARSMMFSVGSDPMVRKQASGVLLVDSACMVSMLRITASAYWQIWPNMFTIELQNRKNSKHSRQDYCYKENHDQIAYPRSHGFRDVLLGHGDTAIRTPGSDQQQLTPRVQCRRVAVRNRRFFRRILIKPCFPCLKLYHPRKFLELSSTLLELMLYDLYMFTFFGVGGQKTHVIFFLILLQQSCKYQLTKETLSHRRISIQLFSDV